jgi:hypothetical protein
MPTLSTVRAAYHRQMHHTLFGRRSRGGKAVSETVEGTSFPVYTNADSHNSVSVVLCAGVADRLRIPRTLIGSQGSTLGTLFEEATESFVEESLRLFSHLSKLQLHVNRGGAIADYAQFAHLATVEERVRKDPELEAALGSDYLVDPDILIGVDPLPDALLSRGGANLTKNIAGHASVRAANSSLPILHASISCKWTMRRDRNQNARLEALNLVRNRKGRLPHIATVTMECDPEILASLALGTGDIDCVYHGALHELVDAADEAATDWGGKWIGKRESLNRMVAGSRLRDISDLPLDLIL